MAKAASEWRFDGRVAVVTGAGRGLGRAYALELARRGAKLLVNDLGGSSQGDGANSNQSRAADVVVEEIRREGGTALPDYHSVVDGALIVAEAIRQFGRVDIVVNNAGILRDVSFHKMQPKDWTLLYQVHLKGTFEVSRAAWPHMRAQGYGRIVNVTSAAGLYGNFGQAAYSSMKMGIVGLTNTMAVEGKSKNILCNTIAPLAASRLTESVLPADLKESLKPEYVCPLVAFLAHERCQENGALFEVGAGWVSKVRRERSEGAFFPTAAEGFSIEDVAQQFNQIAEFRPETSSHPATPQDSFSSVMKSIQNPAGSSSKKGAASQMEPEAREKAETLKKIQEFAFPPVQSSYTERDVQLYALGIGAATDPLNEKELGFVYENQLTTLPTFGVLFGASLAESFMKIPGIGINPMMILHGGQEIKLFKPLPTRANVETSISVEEVLDKGSGAVIVIKGTTIDRSDGQKLCENIMSLFVRGMGGFGGERGSKEESSIPAQRPPDIVHREATQPNQALLYRLSGDLNPLHIDPAMAQMVGFKQPILHGLCTLGFAVRAVLNHFPYLKEFTSVSVRFASTVLPGQTLVTEMWSIGNSAVSFQCKVAETGKIVLSNGKVSFGSSKADVKDESGAAKSLSDETTFKSEAVFDALGKVVSSKLVKQVGAVYQVNVSKGAQTQAWTVALDSGDGAIRRGKTSNPQCTLNVSDDDFMALVNGDLNPQTAFLKGRLKVSGDIMLAQKFDSVLKARSAL